jgi:hypothetical protein
MPIRINLLAEQIAAEDARRRDPVKRAIYVSSALVGLMLLWGAWLYLDIRAARQNLATYETRLQTVEEKAKQTKGDKTLDLEISRRVASLKRYEEVRFYWANVLNGLQQVTVDNIRFMEVSSEQKYVANPEVKAKTNLVFGVSRPPSMWKFWAKAPPSTNALVIVTNLVIVMTNRPPFSTNKVPLVIKINEVATNDTTFEATAKLELITPPTSVEEITMVIDGRDYTPSPGSQVEELRQAIMRNPFFKRTLSAMEGGGVVLKSRMFNRDTDPMDPVNPNATFIRFQLECNFERRVLSNE